MTFLLGSSLQVTAILLVAVLSLPLLRKQSAAARHWVLSAAVVFAAITPILTAVMPYWNVADAVVDHPAIAPIQQQIARMTQPATERLSEHLAVQAVSTAQPNAGPFTERTTPTLPRWLPQWIWSVGAAIGFLFLITGLVRLAWVAAAASTVPNGRWTELTQQISSEYQLRRPVRLLQSLNSSILLTWGVLRPRVILPAGAHQWSADRARIVLRHELAHIRRSDWLIQMIAQLVRVVYWFNPLVWIVCRRLRLESECACDDAVVGGNEGIEGHDYAAHLLDLARTLNRRNGAWSTALSMAQSSTIERRFSAMLNPALNRRPATRWLISATLVAGLLISVPLTILSTATGATVPTPPIIMFPIPATPEKTEAPTQPRPQLAPVQPVARIAPQSPMPESQLQEYGRMLEEYRKRLQNTLLELNQNQDVNEALRAFISSQVAQAGSRSQNQAPPTRARDRALYEAAEAGDLAEIDALLGAGANVNAEVRGDGSPLIAAARRGRIEIVTALLERGADPNMPVRGDGNPLIMAARQGHVAVVNLLLDRGANIEQIVPGDENALIQASGSGRLAVVKLLVSRRADVNARVRIEPYPWAPDGEWRTALSMARQGGHQEVVDFLLSVGARD